jgi:large subunit ribosomal protein L22
MEVKAKARYIRMSPKKVRLVIDVIRGMRAEEAMDQLRHMKKAASRPVLKLLESAVANAENNFNLERAGLVIKNIAADGGPIMYRYQPRAFGRSTPIRKRTSHISIVLEGEPPAAKEKPKKKEKASVTSKTRETGGKQEAKAREESSKATEPKTQKTKDKEGNAKPQVSNSKQEAKSQAEKSKEAKPKTQSSKPSASADSLEASEKEPSAKGKSNQ